MHYKGKLPSVQHFCPKWSLYSPLFRVPSESTGLKVSENQIIRTLLDHHSIPVEVTGATESKMPFFLTVARRGAWEGVVS